MFTFLGILPAWSQPLQETLIHLQAKSPEGVRADKYDSYFIVHTGRDITTERLSFSYHLSDQGFASETALEEYMMMNDRFFGAIVFAKSSWVTLPKKLSYKIRLEWNSNWKTDVIFPGRKGSGPSIGSMPS